MKKVAVAVIAGDGIGPEVIPPARSVLQSAGRKHGINFTFEEFAWGTEYYFSTAA